jgi:dTDP-4-amino-4,6-dideoxygalactose transaminase
MGCYSFHDTKNFTCGEGGAILVNDERFIEKAEIIREKGTNRSKYLRGQIDKYTWVDIGSSYLPSELNAAFLYAQLEMAEEVNKKRHALWERYYNNLKILQAKSFIKLPYIPDYCEHNAHIFYIKLRDIEERKNMIEHLENNGIQAVFHYIPLHISSAGKKYGGFIGEDKYTTKESECLLRLPLYYDLDFEEVDYITGKIKLFFNG